MEHLLSRPAPVQSGESHLDLHRVSIAYGDGIGPEIMEAALTILDAAGARLEYDTIEIGERVYRRGISSGIAPEAWDILRRNGLFLKAPITTPPGKGYKSLNVTIRKSMGLFANVRPCRAYAPFVHSHFPGMNLVIVRENEEDLYAGIEHQQTPEVMQCLKLISRPGCERVIRYAFEYARTQGRRKVSCMVKDNIMKMTDGLFYQVFREVAEEYPDIESDRYIIDIGAALLADQPERFDVVVMPNLYGDIASDIAAQIAGSVGLSGSANIGNRFAMFEAIHGSAPDIAGQNRANPSGLIHAACLMLRHLGQGQTATIIQNALLSTLEAGIHTADIYNDAYTVRKVSTRQFTEAVMERLGQQPKKLQPAKEPATAPPQEILIKEQPRPKKELVGIDVFLDWEDRNRNPQVLGKLLEALSGDDFQLKMITNRGVKVYPEGFPETFCTDHWRCRFVSSASKVSAMGKDMPSSSPVSYRQVMRLLERLYQSGLPAIKTENLYELEGKRSYSLGQGE